MKIKGLDTWGNQGLGSSRALPEVGQSGGVGTWVHLFFFTSYPTQERIDNLNNYIFIKEMESSLKTL